MPQITRLVAGKKNPSRVNLYLDGVFVFTLSLDTVVKHGLHLGQNLTPLEQQNLQDADQEDQVYAKILNFLSYRPHSVWETRVRLKHYGITDISHQDRLLARLQAQGQLDDQSFATWFVRSRTQFRPRSARHLATELAAKGISSTIIHSVVSSSIDHLALAQLIRAKSAHYDRPHLVAYLVRRGFSYQDIISELDESGILA